MAILLKIYVLYFLQCVYSGSVSRVGERGKRSGGKRERTRAILIAAALDVVGEKGFTAASLEEIAKRAGMTRGAIYSNFAGRGELLLAAMGSKGLTLSSIRPVDSSLRAQLRAVADALIAALPRAQGESKFLAEFQLYALADPDLRRDIAAGYAAAFGGRQRVGRAFWVEAGDGAKAAGGRHTVAGPGADVPIPPHPRRGQRRGRHRRVRGVGGGRRRDPPVTAPQARRRIAISGARRPSAARCRC